MRHAGAAALDAIEPLLRRIRACGVLKEKSRGAFYFKSRGYLHFHEDAAGMFVDVRAADGKDFDRLKLDAAVADQIVARVVALAGKRA
jgi:hypothetical protein